MKNKSNIHVISDELIAAFLEGNVSAAECRQVLKAIKNDAQLRELLRISLIVDVEMGLQYSKDYYLPMAALAAKCGEENICSLECEKYVMDSLGITYDEHELIENALRNGWQKEHGTALHNVGRHLEKAGLVVSRQYECEIDDIVKSLDKGEYVIVAIDGDELMGNMYMETLEDAFIGRLPNHTIVVIACNIEDDTITIFDPNSSNQQNTYNLEQFANAWADSNNYLVTIKNFTNMNTYYPKPIDVSDVILDEDVTELREAIAENAHEIWALTRINDGWTCGPRNDEKKQNPCIVPYAELPDSEKEYDRKMAMQTIKLMKKLGYDLVKHRDTDLYEQLLRRIHYSTQTFLCPNCNKHGKKTSVYKYQVFCDVCGHELTDVDWTIYDEF